ncbi:MAG: MFS transporter [Saccharospirillum sp.]
MSVTLSSNKEWWVIAAGVSTAMHLAKLPPAIPVLASTMGLSLVQAGFLLSLVQLAGMTLGIIAGSFADSLGLRRSLLIGLLTLAGASLAGGFVTTPVELLGLRALEGIGFLMVVVPAPGLVRRLVVPERLSQRLALWSCFMGVGTGLALLLGVLLLQRWDWSVWWWGLSLLSLLIAAGVGYWVPTDDNRPGQNRQDPLGWRTRLFQTLSSPGPWLVAVIFAMYSSQWLSVIGFLPAIYTQAGVGGIAVALLTALVAAINVVGNLLAGRWLHRGVLPATLLTLGFSAMGLGALLTFAGFTEPVPVLRYLAVLVFSAVGGMIPAVLFSLAVRVAPNERAVSTTVGWMLQWSSLGQFAGPPLVAAVAVGVGGWQWTWAVTGSAALLGIVLARVLSARLV